MVETRYDRKGRLIADGLYGETALRGWTEWEQPWTRATGLARQYEPLTTTPAPGMTVAVRSLSRPYLPTFAPWWLGLVVASVDDDMVRFSNAARFVATLTEYPLATHWAVTQTGGGQTDA